MTEIHPEMTEIDAETQPLINRYKLSQDYGIFENRKRKKGLQQYYNNMDSLLKLYQEDEKINEKHEIAKRKLTLLEEGVNKQRGDRVLSIVVFLFNLGMLFGTLAASILSNSYSILSAFVDSAMDITSSTIIYLTIYAINHTDRGKYPRGRERLELLALTICSVMLSVTNFWVIFQSVQAIIQDQVDPDANVVTVIIICSRILGKSVLWIVCHRQGTPNAKVLGYDQRNDIITSVVALAGLYLGSYVWLYCDPIGAILVSLFISVSWSLTALSYIPLIAGKRANKIQLSRLLQMAISHDPRIKEIDHIMSYHLGERQIVELHVVLAEDCPLKTSHDIVCSLQSKILALDFVDLAFVHADYQLDGAK
uniref:Cation efflux protein cytoplasmic domain-containing protein n=1 Tax=Panagrolaimus sp. JU765 TaxID=591449 RepID=A0AC34R6Y7_9BILA